MPLSHGDMCIEFRHPARQRTLVDVRNCRRRIPFLDVPMDAQIVSLASLSAEPKPILDKKLFANFVAESMTCCNRVSI